MPLGYKLTQEEFLVRAIAVHGHLYDYSATIYTHALAKITIRCAIHGIFEQIANNHIRGSGCALCKGKVIGNNHAFVVKATQTHGDKYDYSQVSYVNSATKVVIICAQHGPFSQSPDNHYKGAGCPSCANMFRGDTHHFTSRALAIHGTKYDYSKVEYVAGHKNITIGCAKHGLFTQTPHNHLAGKGCLKCAREAPGGAWKATSWAARQAGRMALLYVVRLTGNGEDFIKVGITFNSIKKRLKPSRFPYQIEFLAVFASSDGITIHQVEAAIKKRFRGLRYQPNQAFGGRTECYTDAALILAFLAAQNSIKQIE